MKANPDKCHLLLSKNQQNTMKANPDKCHLMLSKNQNKLANINCNAINNSSSMQKSLSGTKCSYQNYVSWMQTKDGLKGKKERVSKQKLLKGCHQGQNIIVLAILERLEFENFSCWPTTVFHSPSTLKSISPALMSARNATIFRIQIGIYDQYFQNFPCNPCEAPELGCIVGLTAILRFLERKNSTFLESVIFIVA